MKKQLINNFFLFSVHSSNYQLQNWINWSFVVPKQIMYTSLSPNGPLKLYHFIIIVAVALAFLSQLPSFHSLRHINFASLLLSLGYTILVSAACIGAGISPELSRHMFIPLCVPRTFLLRFQRNLCCSRWRN